MFSERSSVSSAYPETWAGLSGIGSIEYFIPVVVVLLLVTSMSVVASSHIVSLPATLIITVGSTQISTVSIIPEHFSASDPAPGGAFRQSRGVYCLGGPDCAWHGPCR